MGTVSLFLCYVYDPAKSGYHVITIYWNELHSSAPNFAQLLFCMKNNNNNNNNVSLFWDFEF